MLKQLARWAPPSSSPSDSVLPALSNPGTRLCINASMTHNNISKALKPMSRQRVSSVQCCRARRRTRYEDEDDEDEDGDDGGGGGYNQEIATLELYSQSARGEALLVRAAVDDQEDVQVLIFKGFSSCLSYRTSPDPSRSVVPARAVIKSIDRIKGPFDPSNIEYLEKGLTWEAFKGRLASA